MQIMVMEFARGVLGYKDANSSEFTPDGKHNVIALMADQQGNIPKGGTMRLGKYPCKVMPGTKMAECYGEARSGSATATATSSTTSSVRRCRTPVLLFPAPARTVVW